MLKEKQLLLKEKIKNIISEIGHDHNIKQEIGKWFLERNLSSYRASNVFMSNESVDIVGDNEQDIKFLFLFSHAINEVTEFNIDLKEYFTNIEYNQFINYKEEHESDKIYPIIFEDVQQIGDRIWQGSISAQRFDELRSKNILLYNFAMQRAPKITVSGVRIDFDKRKTIEIKERMLTGKQFPTQIKLNVLNNFEEKIHYNKKEKTLTIYEGDIYIFDGHHRGVGNSMAVDENPEVDFIWGLIISNLTEDEIKEWVVEIDKQKPIKKEQIKQWDLEKKENLVVRVIEGDKISKLNKVMKEQESEIKLNRGLVTKNIIAEAIAENYRLDDTTDIRGLGSWIVEFTDYLFSLYSEVFITDPYKIKEESMINHKYMFYGYIALSADLRDNNNWKEIIKERMSKIDFDKNNSLWGEIGIESRVTNKSIRNKIYKLFTEKKVEVI